MLFLQRFISLIHEPPHLIEYRKLRGRERPKRLCSFTADHPAALSLAGGISTGRAVWPPPSFTELRGLARSAEVNGTQPGQPVRGASRDGTALRVLLCGKMRSPGRPGATGASPFSLCMAEKMANLTKASGCSWTLAFALLLKASFLRIVSGSTSVQLAW